MYIANRIELFVTVMDWGIGSITLGSTAALHCFVRDPVQFDAAGSLT